MMGHTYLILARTFFRVMSLSLSLLILSDKIIIVGFVLLNLYLFLFSVFFVQLPFFNIRYCLPVLSHIWYGQDVWSFHCRELSFFWWIPVCCTPSLICMWCNFCNDCSSVSLHETVYNLIVSSLVRFIKYEILHSHVRAKYKTRVNRFQRWKIKIKNIFDIVTTIINHVVLVVVLITKKNNTKHLKIE
jgi:hypothetical protein